MIQIYKSTITRWRISGTQHSTNVYSPAISFSESGKIKKLSTKLRKSRSIVHSGSSSGWSQRKWSPSCEPRKRRGIQGLFTDHVHSIYTNASVFSSAWVECLEPRNDLLLFWCRLLEFSRWIWERRVSSVPSWTWGQVSCLEPRCPIK